MRRAWASQPRVARFVSDSSVSCKILTSTVDCLILVIIR